MTKSLTKTKQTYKETVFEDSYNKFIKTLLQKFKNEEFCSMEDICDLFKLMQQHEMDGFPVIAGQNGSGKSMVSLMLCKLMNGPKFLDKYFLADKTSNDLINFYLNNEQTTLGVDEFNMYLSYKKHASNEQHNLITMMELARSKSIITIGCVRDPRKLTLNFRDGKMSVIIWILDRFKDKSGSYAAVLVGNPMLESSDRFGLDYLQIDTPSFDDMRGQLQKLPSFIGYMKIPRVTDLISIKELDYYKGMKNKAMAFSQLYNLIKMFKQKQLDNEELNNELNKLRDVLGDEVINQRLAKVNQGQTGLKEFLEED